MGLSRGKECLIAQGRGQRRLSVKNARLRSLRKTLRVLLHSLRLASCSIRVLGSAPLVAPTAPLAPPRVLLYTGARFRSLRLRLHSLRLACCSIRVLGYARCAYGSTRSASRAALYGCRILNYIRVATIRLSISHFIRSKCDIQEFKMRQRYIAAREAERVEP
jgi:hypothetical protein